MPQEGTLGFVSLINAMEGSLERKLTLQPIQHPVRQTLQ